MRYAFIKAHVGQYNVRRLCKAMAVYPSGYYAWQARPLSPRAKDNQRLLGLSEQAWLESGRVCGYCKLALDMCDLDERCGKHRVVRLLKAEGLYSQPGYRRRPVGRAGEPVAVASNHLQRQFTVDAPNQFWVTDIIHIHTHEGWLRLSVVIDLWSRMVVRWFVGQRIDTQLALDASLMALWRRRPRQQVLIHSDQGCQLIGHVWQSFLHEHNLPCSMSQRGNCRDNAVAGGFFQSFKRERVRRQIHATRQEAKSDVFNYTEMLYNPTRRHSNANGLSPAEFKQRHSPRLVGAQESRGDSCTPWRPGAS